MWIDKICTECGTEVYQEKENEYRCPNCYEHYWDADFWIDEDEKEIHNV